MELIKRRSGPVLSSSHSMMGHLRKLKELGYSVEEINQLMIKNPQEAFGVKVRNIQ